jgi:nickel/cobalt exporter
MNTDLGILTLSAASLGFIHTVLGPDHYLPFIVMSRARNWSAFKTGWITVLCGIGHVGSSILLGFIGLSVGLGLARMEGIESFRGEIAAWLFLLFGAGYTIWGIYRLYRKKQHQHIHSHGNGSLHLHEHTHLNEHDHEHSKNITPWLLFTIFVFGPCEILIPVVMYPASSGNTWGIIQVVLVFSVVTVLTMLTIVLLASYGLQLVRLGKLERFTHVIAGITILLSGLGILLLGM